MASKYAKNLDDEIIKLLAEGNVCKEIGVKLNKAYDTIRNRVNQLKINNDCKTITHLVIKYLKLKTMTYVIYNPVNHLYLQEHPDQSEVLQWGDASTAYELATQQEADNLATEIGGGTVGTTKPA